jgi:hypothetical protein
VLVQNIYKPLAIMFSQSWIVVFFFFFSSKFQGRLIDIEGKGMSNHKSDIGPIVKFDFFFVIIFRDKVDS